ncbi:hypothetical protein ACFRAE_12905 [Sphingobacterium sp. HJSM2_6]|uniref:hypothetical protein n=1 Tax=Sphingobacterium sp. HJSM2_6 TaxID=3366264 RepID=UPI003BE316D1
MKTSHKYATTSQAIADLQSKGYSIDFNIEFDGLASEAEQYIIDYLYRYEGLTDPADESSVYGIRNIHTGDKGVFVAGNLSFLEGRKRDIILELELRHTQNNHS